MEKKKVWITISFSVNDTSTDEKLSLKKELTELLEVRKSELCEINNNNYTIVRLVSFKPCSEIKKFITKLKKIPFIKENSIRFDFLECVDTPPEKLYLYRAWNEHTKDIILNNALFLSSPKSFNDPFDCSMAVYENSVSTSDFLENIGIRCFGSRSDNILMWSHYADKHKGICLEFDTKHLLRYDKAEFIRVRYRKQYPIYTTKKEIDIKSAVSYKHIDWKYEGEYRLLHGNSSGKMFHFPSSALTQIYIGCCMSEDDRYDLDKIIQERNKESLRAASNPLQSCSMEKDKYNYKLNIKNNQASDL